MTTFVLIAGGLAFLILGAEMLVRGSSKLALSFGVPPLIVGLTLVAYGTSTPELIVSVQAALAGKPDIAVSNIVGSNIFNVLFILGISAMIAPLVVHLKLIKTEVPIMIAVSALFYLLVLDGNFGRLDGVLFFLGIILYTWVTIKQSKNESHDIKKEYEQGIGARGNQMTGSKVLLLLVLIAGGLALLVVGGRWLVEGAVMLARQAGVSELIIGLTIVAAGTSLPEVATSILATIRGERDIAIGNVVGSNIYNLLAIMGLTGILSPNGVPVAASLEALDIPFMTAVAVACLPVFVSGNQINRWEGAVFLSYYILYTTYLCLHAAEHDMLPLFNQTMMFFVIPITLLTFAVISTRIVMQRTRRV